MSEEVALHEPQAPLNGNPAHVRLSISEVGKVANILADSGLWRTRAKDPVSGRWEDRLYTPAECWAIIMAGQSMGIGPVPAMSSFHMIEGRAEMSANLQAYFLKSSPKYDYRRVFEYDGEDNVTACVVTVFDKQTGEAIGDARYSLAMARKANLIKSGGGWEKYAGAMLFARAVSDATAQIAPDAVPMRIYSEGEISGVEPEIKGVSAVQGEGPVSTTKVEAAVTQALEADEEVIEDAEIVPPIDPTGPVSPEVERFIDEMVEDGLLVEVPFDPATEPLPDPVEPPTLAEDRFSPQAVETRLREDLPKLSDADKQLVKTAVTSARPAVKWGYSGITSLIVKAGFTDVNTWISMLLRPGTRQTTPAGASQPGLTPVGDSLPEGVTGAKTGSQTAAVVSDAQVRMLHARMSACQFDEQEKRYFLQHYADAASTRDVKKGDVDDLLQVLKDIEAGDDATRRAYLGGAAN